MNDFTALAELTLREKREASSTSGILPIAKSMKSKSSENGRFLAKKALKQVVVSSVVETQKEEKRNLLRSELVNEGTQRAVIVEKEVLETDKRSKELDFRSLLVDWSYDWLLPGHGEKYSDCGEWRSRGCLNVEGHNQQGLDEDHVGLVYIQRYQRTCFRSQCPVCYESWAGKEAGKIEYRLKAGPKNRKVIHVIVSPPVEDWVRMEYLQLRNKSYKVAKSSGFWGGSCIFHPFRKKESTNRWYFSPHFHMLGYGWIQGTKEGYESHGWVVKNAGIRKTVSGTALYQLSHAGFNASYHTVTWFGSLSYNKVKVPKMPIEKDVCPVCGSELQNLWYFGNDKLPEEKVSVWLDPEGWEVKPGSQRRWGGG